MDTSQTVTIDYIEKKYWYDIIEVLHLLLVFASYNKYHHYNNADLFHSIKFN